MKALRSIVLICLSLSLLNCNERMTNNELPNKPPATFLWLYPDSTIAVGISRQHIHWWGEDRDGFVQGYLFAFGVFANRVTAIPNPDTLRYIYVNTTDTLIAFPITQILENFTVFARAVDNTFRGLPYGSIVRFQNGPYWDTNDNGVFDGSDVRLPDLPGAVDPIGAIQTFPTRLSPPTINFAPNPNDGSTLKQPDTTFTVATFAFKGVHPDGPNLLTGYRIALNDSGNPASWLGVGLRDTIITFVVPRSRSDAKVSGDSVTADVYAGPFLGRRLIGTLPGMRLDSQNKFFVQSVDVAGQLSPTIAMPSGTDRWFVRKPMGSLLLLNDYLRTAFDNPEPIYLSSLNVSSTFATISFLDIGRNMTNDDRSSGKFGPAVPPFVDPALINTLLLFDYVVWYTDRFPSLGVAQSSLFNYLQNGGRVIFSTSFTNNIDPRGALRDFAPIDSVDTEPLVPAPPPPSRGATAIRGGTVVIPDSSTPSNVYPQLAFNTDNLIQSVFMRPVYRRSDASYIYRLAPDSGRYLGSPNIGVVDGQRKIVFIGLPLHLLNNSVQGNPEGLTAFFRKALTQQFNRNQKVDRRRF